MIWSLTQFTLIGFVPHGYSISREPWRLCWILWETRYSKNIRMTLSRVCLWRGDRGNYLSVEKVHTKTYSWFRPRGPGESWVGSGLDRKTIGAPLGTFQCIQHEFIKYLQWAKHWTKESSEETITETELDSRLEDGWIGGWDRLGQE